MKRLIDIIFITIFLIHFVTNTMINIIGVPLAAYHSYKAWEETDIINHSDYHQKTEKYKHIQSNKDVKVDKKDSLSRTQTKDSLLLGNKKKAFYETKK